MKKLIIAALVTIILVSSMFTPVVAQDSAEATVEVRVWQEVGEELHFYISARPAGGSWGTVGTIPLPLDDGVSGNGRYRYGDIRLDVPLPDRTVPVTVELRVWQHVSNSARIYVSARLAEGDWASLGTAPLPLDDGVSSTGRFRYGDIRLKVPLPEGAVTTLAGSPGVWGYADGRGEGVRFARGGARGLAIDRDGSVVVADPYNHAIRRIAPDGKATTIAGGIGRGLRDGPQDVAQFERPLDVALAGDGSIYVADTGNGRIRRIGTDGVVTTVAGSVDLSTPVYEARDGPALEAVLREPRALALDTYGNLYIIEARIRLLSPSGLVSTLAGGVGGRYHRDGPVDEAKFRHPVDIDVDDAGNVYVLDVSHVRPSEPGAHSTVRVIDTSGVVSTLHRSTDPSHGGTLASPSGIAVTGDGQVFLSNTGRHQIVRLGADGQLRGVAGTAEQGLADGPHWKAQFSEPEWLAIAPDGTLYVADQGGAVIRKVGTGGHHIPLVVAPRIAQVAGVSMSVLAGREWVRGLVDGPAGRARFQYPLGLALGPSGNVLVADTDNHAIRRVDANGTVTTVAGGNGQGIRDGPVHVAQFSSPHHITVAPDGTVYVIDIDEGSIRKVAPGGSVETLSGAIVATFPRPWAIAADQEGNLYISDAESRSIGVLSPEGEISIIASAVHMGPIAVDAEGSVYYHAEGAFFQSVAIKRTSPQGVTTTLFEDTNVHYGSLLSSAPVAGLAVSPEGTLYAADEVLGRIVRISRGGEVSIVVGHDSPARPGFRPVGIAVGPGGSLVVADPSANVIWQITFEDDE